MFQKKYYNLKMYIIFKGNQFKNNIFNDLVLLFSYIITLQTSFF